MKMVETKGLFEKDDSKMKNKFIRDIMVCVQICKTQEYHQVRVFSHLYRASAATGNLLVSLSRMYMYGCFCFCFCYAY